jgi:hypothetical protein
MKPRSIFAIVIFVAVLIVIAILTLKSQGVILPTSTLEPPATLTPTTTSIPSDTPQPTKTIDPTTGWLEYSDPQERFSIKYPPSWYLSPAPFDNTRLGYATHITSFDTIKDAEQQPDRGMDFEPGEFYVSIGYETFEIVPDVDLAQWVEERRTSDGTILTTTSISIDDKTAIQQDINLFPGHTMRVIYSTTSDGIISLVGQPMESPKSSNFELLLSTLRIW